MPTDFAGLELWLRADVGVTLNAGHVQSWLDQSGQGNHASQSVPNAQPTFQAGVFNGHPAVDFDGTADRLLIADADGLDPGQDSFLCVAAGRWLGGFGNYDVWSGKTDDASADDWRLYRMANGTLRVYWGGVGDGYNTSTAIASDGVNYVLGWGYDATSSEVLYVVGSTTERLSAAAQGLGQNGQPMVIGADTVAYWAQMRLAEEVFYKRIGTGFPSSEVDQIVEYFRVRYGL